MGVLEPPGKNEAMSEGVMGTGELGTQYLPHLRVTDSFF